MNKAWNYATDLAINTHIPDELPPLALVPGRGPYAEFPPGLSAEAYLKLLKDQQDEEDDKSDDGDNGGSSDDSDDSDGGDSGDSGGDQPGEGDGDGDSEGSSSGSGEPSLDDHSGWGEGDGTTDSIAQERLKDMVKKAAHEAAKRGWGSVSGDMRQTIMDSITTKVDWKKVLRSFVKASQKAARR